MTIEIKMCARSEDEIIDFHHDEIILVEKFWMRRYCCDESVPDELMGKKEINFDYEDLFLKSSVAEILYTYITDEKKYAIKISSLSGNIQAEFWFEEKDEAMKVRDRILNWLLSDK